MRRRTHRTHQCQRALTGITVFVLACLADPYNLSMANQQDLPVNIQLQQATDKPVVDDSVATGDPDNSNMADALEQGTDRPGRQLTTRQKRLFVLGIQANELK